MQMYKKISLTVASNSAEPRGSNCHVPRPLLLRYDTVSGDGIEHSISMFMELY